LTILTAAYLYYLAAAGEADAAWLAELALTRGQQQVVMSISSVLDAAPGADSGRLSELWRDGRSRIQYARDRAQQSIRSVLRFAPTGQFAWLTKLEDTLSESARLQVRRLEAAIRRRAQELGVQQIEPALEPADSQLDEARNLVVRRKRFGTLPLDEIAPDQREGQPSGAWADTQVKALYWCDGSRTLAEVIRLTRLEAGPTSFDFVKYFRFLEKKGYVEFVVK
jgi:hypothetical protein